MIHLIAEIIDGLFILLLAFMWYQNVKILNERINVLQEEVNRLKPENN